MIRHFEDTKLEIREKKETHGDLRKEGNRAGKETEIG